MRTVEYTHRFKRDYRREKSGRSGRTLDAALMEVVHQLGACLDNRLDGRSEA